MFVLFSTEAEASEATEAWGAAAVKRGIVAIAAAEEDGRGHKGKVRELRDRAMWSRDGKLVPKHV